MLVVYIRDGVSGRFRGLFRGLGRDAYGLLRAHLAPPDGDEADEWPTGAPPLVLRGRATLQGETCVPHTTCVPNTPKHLHVRPIDAVWGDHPKATVAGRALCGHHG